MVKDWNDISLTIPNVRDSDGCVIMPNKYESKLKDGSIVIVNVHFKLYVFILFTINIIPFLLTIGLCSKITNTCDRHYEVVLNSR